MANNAVTKIGSASLATDADVKITSVADGDLLQFKSADSKWENVAGVAGSKITSGQVATAQGGTGADLSGSGGTTKVLAQDASHIVSARDLVAADIPNHSATKITSGQVALAQGGTNADLSGTGGSGQVLKQTSVGAAVTVAQVADADLSLTDITTNDVSTTKHGFAPKAPNDATKYLDGSGAYSVPAGSGGSSGFPDVTGLKRFGLMLAGGSAGSAGLAAAQGCIGDNATLTSVFTQNTTANANHGQATEFRNASIDTAAGLAGQNMWWFRRNLSAQAIVYLTALTDVSFWFVITDGAITNYQATANPASRNHVGFRFDVISASDSAIQCVTRDGTTQAVATSGLSFSANVPRRLAMVMNDGTPNVKFYIDGVLVATATNNIPATGTQCKVLLAMSYHTTAKQMGVSQVVIASDF